MITSLHIQNFQSHANSELNFSPGVNIIIGSSDSGKTAIIRAIRWIVWNRPSGNSICSHWGEETKVCIETKEGSIIRSKDKVDKYILEENNIRKGNKRTKTELKAFGASVPEEVNRFLNINEINLQQQLDAPFLLSISAGEVAKHFNKVAKLDKIDKGTSNINSAISKLKSTIATKTEDIENKKIELAKFEYLEEFETKLEVLEELEKRRNNIYNKQTKLVNLLTKANIVIEEIESYQDIISLEEPVQDLLNLYERKKVLAKKEIRLNKALSTYILNKDEIFRISPMLDLEAKINVLQELYSIRNNKMLQYERLSKAMKVYNSIYLQLNEEKQKHTQLLKRFNKEFPQQCPLCGLLVPHDHNLKI
jgi:exonuclease SbcC